jgi:hypothetical protein
MTNPIIKIVNCTTGEEIERPMTDQEYADFLNPKKAIGLDNAEQSTPNLAD